MIVFLKRADHVIFKIQEYICIITSVLITSLIVIAAIMRYILGINFGGSEELVLFAAFWFYFTGSSLAYRDDAHINADMTSLLFKSEKANGCCKVCSKYGYRNCCNGLGVSICQLEL